MDSQKKELERLTNLQKLEITHWFSRSCREPGADFSWYFQPATKRNTAGFVICKEQPANKEYSFLCKVDCSQPVENVFYHIKQLTQKLPIFSN